MTRCPTLLSSVLTVVGGGVDRPDAAFERDALVPRIQGHVLFSAYEQSAVRQHARDDDRHRAGQGVRLRRRATTGKRLIGAQIKTEHTGAIDAQRPTEQRWVDDVIRGFFGGAGDRKSVV